jgi:hypothetical protein
MRQNSDCLALGQSLDPAKLVADQSTLCTPVDALCYSPPTYRSNPPSWTDDHPFLPLALPFPAIVLLLSFPLPPLTPSCPPRSPAYIPLTHSLPILCPPSCVRLPGSLSIGFGVTDIRLPHPRVCHRFTSNQDVSKRLNCQG